MHLVLSGDQISHLLVCLPSWEGTKERMNRVQSHATDACRRAGETSPSISTWTLGLIGPAVHDHGDPGIMNADHIAMLLKIKGI